MAELLTVAKADELSPGPTRWVEVHAKRLALFNNDGNFNALEDTCADEGGPSSEGAYAGDHVTCLWHVAKFNIRTGRGARPSGAPKHRPLQRSADGGRYRGVGLAMTDACDHAEG
jgi:nitrite reductase/ring-hydroxylating ferredoxin subunit